MAKVSSATSNVAIASPNNASRLAKNANDLEINTSIKPIMLGKSKLGSPISPAEGSMSPKSVTITE